MTDSATPVVSTWRKQRILGVNFFNGRAEEAVAMMDKAGGFLVAPSGTCFGRLQRDVDYRRAMTSADCALADSGFMAILWRTLKGGTISRISGLHYLQILIASIAARSRTGTVFWILPNEAASKQLVRWSHQSGVLVAVAECYVAPLYQSTIDDPCLIERIARLRPSHVIIGIGAGPQEKLGYFLREHLPYRPAIHCIGGALGVLIGDQRSIPRWADRLYLGWMFRLVAQPRIFIPRLWRAIELPGLIRRYGSELPPLRT